MLHNVPVARILGFLFLASVALLAWMTYDGYRTAAGTLSAGAHIRFALFGMVIVLFTRSEEHTSELQSLAYLVCRLLLEKKKKTREESRWYHDHVANKTTRSHT